MTEDSINNHFEQEHFISQEQVVSRINSYYEKLILQISPIIASTTSKALIKKKLDQLIAELVASTALTIEAGIQKSWEVAKDRTEDFIKKKYKGLPTPVIEDSRDEALKQFLRREKNGLKLSDRVWKTGDQYKQVILTKFDEGFPDGKSAAKVAKEIRQALQSSEKTEKPGHGVYRSPKKNAERLARTEINMAYRASDQEAWEKNPLVLGYTINLSATNKPKVRCEICKALAGDYPVDYVWSGNHPHCLCFKTPILMSREMLNQYNKIIAQGKDSKDAIRELQKNVRITDVPESFKSWVLKNNERVSGWKSQPYFWNDNKKTIEAILKPSQLP